MEKFNGIPMEIFRLSYLKRFFYSLLSNYYTIMLSDSRDMVGYMMQTLELSECLFANV